MFSTFAIPNEKRGVVKDEETNPGSKSSFENYTSLTRESAEETSM